jgi:hypothetical protein
MFKSRKNITLSLGAVCKLMVCASIGAAKRKTATYKPSSTRSVRPTTICYVVLNYAPRNAAQANKTQITQPNILSFAFHH